MASASGVNFASIVVLLCEFCGADYYPGTQHGGVFADNGLFDPASDDIVPGPVYRDVSGELLGVAYFGLGAGNRGYCAVQYGGPKFCPREVIRGPGGGVRAFLLTANYKSAKL